MDILKVLRKEAEKFQRQADALNPAAELLSGSSRDSKDRSQRKKEAAFFCRGSEKNEPGSEGVLEEGKR